MKTTVEISGPLLSEAKRVAARAGTSLRALIEEGLRRTIQEHRQSKRAFKLELVTFRGTGPTPGVDWDLPRHLAYDLPALKR